MRKKVINAELDFAVSTCDMIEEIASVGWDGVFTSWYNGEQWKKIVDMIRSTGLYFQSVHAPFGGSYLLWEDDARGEEEKEKLIACVRDSAQAGVNIVVMHAIIGMERNSPNNLGVERFSDILDVAHSEGVKVALENTEGIAYVDKIASQLGNHPALGFCIDTGHEMCYNYSQDIIGKFGKKIIATHLNDNMKMSGDKLTWLDDAHLMPFDGLADWNDVARRLVLAEYSGPISLELTSKSKPDRTTHDRYAQLSVKEYLSLALEKAKAFEKLLNDAENA